MARGGLGVAPALGGQRFSPCAPVLVRGSRATPCPFPPLAKASLPPLFLPRAPRARTPRSRLGALVHLPSVNMAGRAGGGAGCHPARACCGRVSSAAVRPRISTRVKTPQVGRPGAGGRARCAPVQRGPGEPQQSGLGKGRGEEGRGERVSGVEVRENLRCGARGGSAAATSHLEEGRRPGNKEGEGDGGVKGEGQTPAGGDDLGDGRSGHPVPFTSVLRPRGARSVGEEAGAG